MEVWPDLFGRALLLRQWGRIGTEGHRRLDPHPDPGAAINALSRLAGRKRRRGYQEWGVWAYDQIASAQADQARRRCASMAAPTETGCSRTSRWSFTSSATAELPVSSPR